MPTLITEFFNGGLVTAQHPALLKPGELQRCDDCVVREKSLAIQRAPGRTAFNASALGGGIKGLAQLTFDQETDQVVAWPANNGSFSNMYRSDFTSISSGVFSVITGPGTIASCVTNGTTTITAPANSFTNMVIGAKVSGATIGNGTYVTAVNSGINITISQNATGSGTQTLTFDCGVAVSLSDSSTDMLDIIQWQNTYFMLTRNNTVQRLMWFQPSGPSASETIIMRPAGLLPVTQQPIVTVQSGPAWSPILGNGYYWFLVTEILISNDPKVPDVEAGYAAVDQSNPNNIGRAVVVNITNNASQFIRVTFPTLRNDGTNGRNLATNWGVYMSVIDSSHAAYGDPTTMPSLATFRRIAKPTVDSSVTFIDFKFTTATQGFSLPTTSAAIGGLTQFQNPSGVFDRGGGIASGVSGGGSTAANAFAGFGFSTSFPYTTYGITGISVTIVSSIIDNTAGYWIWLDNNGTKVSNKNFGVSDRTTMFGQTWGGQFEPWGVAWTNADIGNLRVNVQKSYSAAIQALRIDYIEVKVWYNGAAVDSGSIDLNGVPYQVVTYRSQIGTTVNDPTNYTIPIATTGDIFQGSLVLNNISIPSQIQYSLPNAPESFPKPYLLKFESKRKDIVTFIRKVGQVLVVGMRDSIKRVNYLPTEADVDFQQGVAHEDIVTDHGIVGPLAGTLIDLPGVGVVLAYVSYNGFYFTDGITTRPLNLDIKIGDLVNTAALSSCVLRVYPREKWMVFYYCPNGASHTKNTRAIVFSYSPLHAKDDGFLPAFGPLTVSGRSSTHAILGGVPYLLTGHETNGTVYVEDSGDTQATGYQVHDSSNTLANAPIIPIIRTRRFYPSGYDKDTRDQRIYILHDATGASQSVTSTLNGTTTVTSAALFGTVLPGMRVSGTGIPINTVVTAKASSSSITISNAATISASSSLTFDDGTLGLTPRGNGINETITTLGSSRFVSTVVGDLFVLHYDTIRQSLELQIDKLILPDGVTQADLNQQMRLFNFSFFADEAGTEMNRATS